MLKRSDTGKVILRAFTPHLHMKKIFSICLIILLSCSEKNDMQETPEGEVVEEHQERAQVDEQALLRRFNEPFKGDLTQIKKRRLLRVLVNYSKSNFFFDAGTARGFEYELSRCSSH